MQSLSQIAREGAPRRPGPAGRRLRGWRLAGAIALTVCLSSPALAADLLAGFDVEPLAIETADGERLELEVYVARTGEQRRTGLMFVESLARRRGMLFTYDPPRVVSMWMKNTLLSLDMLFLRSDGTIERIAARTEPMSERHYVSSAEVGAVLELNAGTAEELGIRPGDRVRHPWLERD